jgi:hypothetical protein
MDYTFLLGSIENILGKSHKKARDNHAFHCPFCNHHKPKLEINFHTNEKGENPWECWVCETRGRTVRSLLRQLKTAPDVAREVLKYLPKGVQTNYYSKDIVSLPEEYKPLYGADINSFAARRVKKYLYGRGLSDNDFIKYSIGYTTSGEYGGRIIVPSYTESGTLNYFVARSYDNNFYKYRNPETSKDVIFFENLINWNLPIVLCEGVFDAMAIKRNAIPLLGKSVNTSLYKKILTSNIKDIYIALDIDARKKALQIAEKFSNEGKRVFLIDLPEKDPSDMGFKSFTNHIQTAEELDISTLMIHKLGL